jgi:hypothetical protein
MRGRTLSSQTSKRTSTSAARPKRNSRATARRSTRNFTDIERAIEDHKKQFAQHPFLKWLESTGAIEDFHGMAKRLTFFVLCFQDMLRLVRLHVSHPQLSAFTRTHEAEDKGHDKWFLSDLQHFGITVEVSWVFGPAHETARDISYEIVAEILRARDDWSRLAVLLSLEGAGAECFGRAIGFLERLGKDQGLKYFARHHQRVEQEHEVFDPEKRRSLLGSRLSMGSFEHSRRAINQTFSSMTKFMDYLANST